MVRLLADFHHEDLFASLQFLFEKRLGWELYRPMGLEWYEQGFWHIFPHIDTAKQFLGLDQSSNRPKDIRGNPLSDRECLNARYTEEDGVFYIANPTKDGNIQRGITLDRFRATKFDILISSIPQHIEPFNRLIVESQPHAKHIFQVGNAWGHLPGVQNILASTAPFPVPSGINTCFYHQEFDTSIFSWEPPTVIKRVNSYIHWMRDKYFFDGISQMGGMKDWVFRSYGAGMEETIAETSKIAATMKASGFTYHYKPEGDGYGHILHNSFACGRPVIINTSHYQGKLGEGLLENGSTCIDLRRYATVGTVSQALEFFGQPEEHEKMCENVRKKFNQIVNFDYEFEHILKPFLERLI